MLISRLCRVGFRVAKELSRGGYAYMSRSRYTQRHCSQYQWSTLELLPETRAFQGSMFQKHHGFSTSASDSASAGADEEKGSISVTFVSKDGEEIPIQVPIGMSMLEAAHENDIELEGLTGRVTKEEVQELIMLSASANKLSKLKEQAEEYASLIMVHGRAGSREFWVH